LFGCVQGRFKILRREWFEWDIDFVVRVSEVCTILHNMLVRLRCEGELDDEVDINGNRVCNETFIEEFIGSIGNESEVSGFGNNGAGTEIEALWSVTTAIGQILEHNEVITSIAVRNEIVGALTEHT
jgi:Plant transposon protein